jgi:hypothetical protein
VTEVYVLGDDPEAPEVPAVVMLDMPPGYVLFRHAHICHRFEVVVKGSLVAGDRTLRPGDVMTARPGEWYGPHIAGPEGCTTAEVFGTLDGVSDHGRDRWRWAGVRLPPGRDPTRLPTALLNQAPAPPAILATADRRPQTADRRPQTGDRRPETGPTVRSRGSRPADRSPGPPADAAVL